MKKKMLAQFCMLCRSHHRVILNFASRDATSSSCGNRAAMLTGKYSAFSTQHSALSIQHSAFSPQPLMVF
jgi:hypothetical protein